MNISRAAAQEIVEEIGREIHENINMMDEEGRIIASTDSGRIGKIHEGARRLIAEKLSEFFVTEEMETDSMKKGINLPIVVLGSVVGVIGITGSREKVSGYGNIVRHMTEIMVTESIRRDSQRYGHRVSYRFLEEWIEQSDSGLPDRELTERGHQLGIDITKPYRLLAVTFHDYSRLSSTLDGQRELEKMESDIRHAAVQQDLIYLRTPPYQILFLPACGDEQMENTAVFMKRLILSRFQRTMACGCDSSRGDHRNLKKAARQAYTALDDALHIPEGLAFYDRLGMTHLVRKIPTEAKQDFADNFFRNIPAEKIDEYMQIIRAYFEYNGSIQQMSEALFLHKNTLQYRLKKLAEYTGTDIRSAYGAADYLTALWIREEDTVL